MFDDIEEDLGKIGRVTIETPPCVVCRKISYIEVDAAKFHRWQSGEHIQNLWPEKTPMERETMISGVCSQEHWDELWGDDDE